MRNHSLKFIGVVSLILFWGSSLAQLDHGKVVSIKQFEGFDIADLMIDDHGIIWISTLNQIHKFDGYDVTHITVDNNDPHSLQSMLGATRLFQDKKNNIWIAGVGDINRYSYSSGTFSNLPIKLDSVSEEYLPKYPGDFNFNIYDINETDSGSIVFSFERDRFSRFDYNKLPTTFSPILTFNPKKDKFEWIKNQSNRKMMGTYLTVKGVDNDLWMLDINGIFHLDKNLNITWVNEISSDPSVIKTIEIDTEGNVWILKFPGELSVFNIKTKEVKRYSLLEITSDHPFPGFGYDMVFDKEGKLWIAWDRGIVYFDPENEKLTYSDLMVNSKNSKLSIRSLRFDDFENLWIGTTQGLYKYFNRPSFNSWGYTSEANRDLIQGWSSKLVKDKNGLIWIVTIQADLGTTVTGVTTYNPKTNVFESIQNSALVPGESLIFLLGEPIPGKLLLSTGHGYYLYDVDQNTASTISIDGLSNTIITKVLKHDKNIWMGTINGIYKLDNTFKVTDYYDLSKYEGSSNFSNAITGFVAEEKEGIWISTKGGLFFYRHSSNTIEKHELNIEPPGGIRLLINSMARTPDGTIWLGLWQGGLCRYNPNTKTVKNFSVKDGLGSMSVQGILYDEPQKHLWLSTFDGISMLDLNDLNFYNYYLDDGIRTLKYAEGSYLSTSSGQFMFGGLFGITYFDPSRFSTKAIPPKVFINEFEVDDRALPISQRDSTNSKNQFQFTLNYSENNISIQYTGIQYDNVDKNRFAYRLVNYDNNWREVKSIRTAYFYNLPPGEFVFQVKAANSNGVWSDPVELSFKINSPWWKTNWAYTGYGMLTLLALFIGYKIQHKRIIARERALAHEKEIIHAREIEVAYNELKAAQTQLIQSEKMAALGELTAGIAHEIQNPLNFVNNFSDVNKELLEELKEEASKGNLEEIKTIADDVIANEEKINHHGKRADAIVKGMLQHSRTSSGQKELTDINSLCDEYLRLAFHGMRAKDKSFNAKLATDFDSSIPKVNVVPQDIGRVILGHWKSYSELNQQRILRCHPEALEG